MAARYGTTGLGRGVALTGVLAVQQSAYPVEAVLHRS